jgi:hypothetical protein
MRAVVVGLVVTGTALVITSPALAGQVFGVESFTSSIIGNVEGSAVTQAGSHPYALTATVVLNHQVTREEETFAENLDEGEVPLKEPEVFVRTGGDPRDLAVSLPAGLIVDPTATPVRCTEAQLESNQSSGGGCPAASAVGIITLYASAFGGKIKGAVYNMVPPPGVPAELGVDPGEIGLVLHIAGNVRSNGDYGFTADISEMGEAVSIYGLSLTLWGDPSDASHDPQRGACAASGEVRKSIEKEFWEDEIKKKGTSAREYRFSCPTERTDTSLLTLPGACTGKALETTLSVNSWQQPDAVEAAAVTSPAVTGCEALQFNPTLEVNAVPEAAPVAESPTGLSVDLTIPHEESVEGLAEADLKHLTVALPQGLGISLSAANGLGACGPTEVGSCPDASKIGEAEASTPLLEEALKGGVYLAQPDTVDGSLIGLYVVLEGSGMAIKLTGKARLDPGTGQITIAFADIPQLPLSEIKLGLFGGPRAVLQTPTACGTYATTATLTPWSGTPAVARTSRELTMQSGCGRGFAPSFIAGSTDAKAGGFSPLSVTLSRQDGEQHLSAIAVRLPAGLLAALGSVVRCPEAQATSGQCSAASEIGQATIAAGPGEDPVWIKGGIYLTGPYDGAPLGLSIVVAAIAGPFDLGDVVIRARIGVDRHTAQLTLTSDPLPSILEGVLLDIRTVNLTVDRPDFLFNPTSCAPQALTATIASAEVGISYLSTPFQARDCKALSFTPKVTALTHAKTSKADGAYLHVRVASGGAQANIAKIKMDLPKRLPARLTALQGACPVHTFEAKPANCPVQAAVGRATLATPMFAKPLLGPAYLVSHGKEASPALVIALQGEGVLIDLEGQMSITHGVASIAFRSLPDVPISRFDLILPTGPQSLLASTSTARPKRGLCAQTLKIPTALTAQDGAVVKQTTRIAVSGCPEQGKARATKAAGRTKPDATSRRRKK